jgi:anthranilate synthase component 1
MHLVSGVTGTLEPGFDMFDLFASCFPAGTVVGAPKIRALELIDELEPQPRDYYAGTIGYFGHGGVMDQAICIRTLFFEKGGYRFQSGAGIVADSQPETEYDEVLSKGGVLRAALELAAEGL